MLKKNLCFCHNILSPISSFHPLFCLGFEHVFTLSNITLIKNLPVIPSVSPPLQSEGKVLNSFHRVLFLFLKSWFLNKPQISWMISETPKICCWFHCVQYRRRDKPEHAMAQEKSWRFPQLLMPSILLTFSLNIHSLIMQSWYLRANVFNKPL